MSGRPMAVAAFVAALLLSAGYAPAQDGGKAPAAPPAPPAAKPPTAEEAVAAALEAWKAKDEARLADLARTDPPDPWIVAEALCAAGEFDAAEAFAKAAPRPEVERLPEHVAARRAAPPDPAAAAAVAAASAALGRGEFSAALEAADAAKGTAAGMDAARLLFARGQALRGLKRNEDAAKAFLESASASASLGWLQRAVLGYQESGGLSYNRSDFRGALSAWEAARDLETTRGNRRSHAAFVGNTGAAWLALGDSARALELFAESLRELEDVGDRRTAVSTLANIGAVKYRTGDIVGADEAWEKEMRFAEELGNRAGVAGAMARVAGTQKALGFGRRALELRETSLRMMEELGDRAGVAVGLGDLGSLLYSMGHHARALEVTERALAAQEKLGRKSGIASALGTLGSIHDALADPAKAREFIERSLAIYEAIGDRRGAAMALGNLGNVHTAFGDYAKALETQERAFRMKEEAGDRAGAARTLSSVALAHLKLGDHAKAIEIGEQALGRLEAQRDREAAARTLVNLSRSHRNGGDAAKAVDCLARARALAEEIDDVDTLVHCLGEAATVHFEAGRHREAVAEARALVEATAALVAGVGEQRGSSAREQWMRFFEIGCRAARALDDAAEACFFIESGRAGAFLEALRTRDAVGTRALAPALAEADRAARAKETAAAAALRRALAGTDGAKAAAARRDLDAARAGVAEVVDRIQREDRAAANLSCPKADSVDLIRSRLAPEEALVLYGMLDVETMALVLTAKEARLVPLGPSKDVLAACMGMKLHDRAVDSSAAVEALRRAVVTPLGLDAGVRRILVSPDRLLCYMPFGVLAPDLEVAYVPSGTIHGLLHDERRLRGSGTLALGDPAYPEKRTPAAAGSLRSGWDLVRLPATGAEAKSVGTVALIGAEATEKGLRDALARSARWRSVHLACHGLVDTERPMHSALALTPSAEDDGFLTVMDVFRLKVPADLVVLSACETGRGKVLHSEGIMGLTRAFMFAGSPRVLVSLWKVDDEATRALMEKFYALWSPKDGGPGLGAAAALRGAQAHVAAQEKWKHPCYWAAWVLWGLGE